MSDKNFLQELQSIKQKIERARKVYSEAHDEASMELLDLFDDTIEQVQEMINLCIEIQLAITKDEKLKEFIKDRYK